MDTGEIYYLPTTLLRQHSAYFKACLSGTYQESHTNEVKLDDVDPALFKHFVGWLYSKAANMADISIPEDCDQYSITEQEDLLVALWFLGDRFLAEQLQNDCIDALRLIKQSENARTSVLKMIDDRGGRDTTLREFYVKQLAFDLTCLGHHRSFITGDDAWTELSADTLRDLIPYSLLFYDNIAENYTQHGALESPVVDPAKETGCLWHIHDLTSENECAARKAE